MYRYMYMINNIFCLWQAHEEDAKRPVWTAEFVNLFIKKCRTICSRQC